MKNIFKLKWIEKKGFSSMAQEESEGAEHYRHLASEFTEMAEDECNHKEKLEEMETNKAQIEKPGQSIHSAKWDSCVAEVGKDPSINAYAVCTSKLGEESFKSNMTKSELEMAKNELKKAIDTAYAGPIPNSKLAEQDLEGETRKVAPDVCYYCAGRGMIKGKNGKWFDCPKCGGSGVIEKGTIEQTGKQLDEEIKQADNSSDFVENIKAIQLKRQKAILEERSNETFKSNWKKKYERK